MNEWETFGPLWLWKRDQSDPGWWVYEAEARSLAEFLYPREKEIEELQGLAAGRLRLLDKGQAVVRMQLQEIEDLKGILEEKDEAIEERDKEIEGLKEKSAKLEAEAFRVAWHWRNRVEAQNEMLKFRDGLIEVKDVEIASFRKEIEERDQQLREAKEEANRLRGLEQYYRTAFQFLEEKDEAIEARDKEIKELQKEVDRLREREQSYLTSFHLLLKLQ